ncbi:hypothetical protein K4H96_1523 [Streptococcus sanguinis]|uniref:hypothetical protein n=1 Tax=Streptococcus sanguinis TaxID=1305 RepID=UPI001CC0E799|nr:hypothetical protein [Streptococcus sanguinis]MBZ2040059.1 hypothetical protein [Streptococcus sanguinis]MCC3169463.1 hypothetical protein [Streptococcus sanguinis]
MKKYLKQLPLLLLFYGIVIGSDLIWNQIWQYFIENTESIERDLSWLSNLNSFYYMLLLPLIGAVIVYINTRMQGFSLPFLLLIPGVNYYYLFKNFFDGLFFSGDRLYNPITSTLYNARDIHVLLFLSLGGILLAEDHRKKRQAATLSQEALNRFSGFDGQ